MSKDDGTPRVYLIRHGATEWSKSGRYTGVSDLPLLPEGEEMINQTASVAFGRGKLVGPEKLAKIYVSPRSRATRTLELLLDSAGNYGFSLAERTIETESVAEWGYGDYEGLLPKELKALRKERGHADGWDIWRDGTEGEGSERPEDVARRIDGLIEEMVEMQARWMEKGMSDGGKESAHGVEEGLKGCDVLVIAHGHSLRAFVKRWLSLELGSKVELMLEPGGVCGLSYAHGNVKERAALVGMSFPQP